MDEPAEIPAAPQAASPRGEIHLGALQGMPFAELLAMAAGLNLKATPDRSRHQLILDILKHHAANGDRLLADGILELSADNYGFLRWRLTISAPAPRMCMSRPRS